MVKVLEGSSAFEGQLLSQGRNPRLEATGMLILRSLRELLMSSSRAKLEGIIFYFSPFGGELDPAMIEVFRCRRVIVILRIQVTLNAFDIVNETLFVLRLLAFRGHTFVLVSGRH